MDLSREAFCARVSARCQAAEVSTKNRGNSEGGCGSASRTRNCSIYIIVLHKKIKWTERKTRRLGGRHGCPSLKSRWARAAAQRAKKLVA
ncbi:unnamed protein product [Ixodes hexagonus]